MWVARKPSGLNRYGVGLGEGDISARRALVAAIEAPGGRSVLRSHLVLDHLLRSAQGTRGIPKDLQLTTRVFPFAPSSSRRAIDRALLLEPEAVILLGETHTDNLRLERIALNRQPWGENAEAPKAILEGAPLAYFTAVSLEAAQKAVRRSGLKMEVAARPMASGGNTAYFTILHRLLRRVEDSPLVVLIEIPIRSRALSLQDATRGVFCVLRFLLGAKGVYGSRGAAAAKPSGSTPAAGRKG